MKTYSLVDVTESTVHCNAKNVIEMTMWYGKLQVKLFILTIILDPDMCSTRKCVVSQYQKKHYYITIYIKGRTAATGDRENAIAPNKGNKQDAPDARQIKGNKR